SADLLPPRRADHRPRGRDSDPPQRGHPQVRPVGGERGDRQVQGPRRSREAGPAQLPARALALSRGVTAQPGRPEPPGGGWGPSLGPHVGEPQGAARPRRASSPSRSSGLVPSEVPPGTAQKISNSSPSG